MNSDDRSNLDFLLGLDPEEAVDVLEEFSQEDLEYANELLEACSVTFAQRQQLLINFAQKKILQWCWPHGPWALRCTKKTLINQ